MRSLKQKSHLRSDQRRVVVLLMEVFLVLLLMMITQELAHLLHLITLALAERVCALKVVEELWADE